MSDNTQHPSDDQAAANQPGTENQTAADAASAPQTSSAATPQTPVAPAAPIAPPVPQLPAAHAAARPAYAPPAGYAAPAGYTAPAGASFGPAADEYPTIPIDGGQHAAAPVAAPPAERAPKKSSGAAKVAGLLVAVAIVGGGAGLGMAYAGSQMFGTGSTLPAAGPATITVNDTDSVTPTTAIASKVVPSVVTIAAAGENGSGTGSGVIVSEDGYVVTNTHVVTLDGATADASVRVTTSDGRVFDATIVGTDPTYDLAVIKLEGATDLTPIEFASSAGLNVGDVTVAVGAPLGLANTVTEGIVSALNRSIEIASSAAPDTGASDETDGGGRNQGSQDDEGEGEGGEQDSPFFFDFGQGDTQQQATETIKIAVIQTDAAINPGNSGGALVDSEGKLIGINVAIASAGGASGTAGSIGVGFSIPSDVVERVSSEIIESGAATHGLLGANVMSAAAIEGATITGAYIDEVVAGGAAEAGGLQSGDIVTRFNGVPITDSVDLTAQVRAVAAGSEATITYVRGDETQEATVTLGELPL